MNESINSEAIDMFTVVIFIAFLLLVAYVLVAVFVSWLAKKIVVFLGFKKASKFAQGIVIILFLIPPLWPFRTILINPLPSDEEIIRIFNKNRSDFEEAIKFKRYRTNKQGAWYEQPQAKAIYKRLRQNGMSYVEGPFLPLWLPNPYSIETAKKAKQMLDEVRFKVKAKGSFQSSYTKLKNKYGPLLISFEYRRFRGVLTFRYGYNMISKYLLHIPEVPKIENGLFLWPMNTEGKIMFKRRIFNSLNGYPPNWKIGECVYRQIEPHWFIRMCINPSPGQASEQLGPF